MPFEAPEYLEAAAVAEWMRLLPHMQKNKYDKDIYVHTYASYCQAVQHIEEAARLISCEDLTVEGKNETQVKHPAFTIIKEATDRMNYAAKIFGFVPKEVVGKEPGNGTNPLAQFRRVHGQSKPKVME